jgi:hypothetical protein
MIRKEIGSGQTTLISIIVMKKNYLLLSIFLLFFPIASWAADGTSNFHSSLEENRREEITVIDNHSVKVGLGPDQRSVSCTILDAVGSIPSVNGKTEPAVVYVNKEKVHHIRKGLYAWDREGKYRVRLTTKYIREFGKITIRIPSEPAAIENTDLPETLPTYYESLPEGKREEITIIDNYMVEVGLGSDLGSVKSIIQDAIKSIPSVGEAYPEFVLVNDDPIFFIGNGLYSWNSEGSNPVKLTTAFIKKFGNIRVSVPRHSQGDETVLTKPSTVSLQSDETALEKQPSIITKSEESPIAKDKNIAIASAPQQEIKARNPAKKVRKLGLKGFRLARFGMDVSQVKDAIQKDLNIDESRIETSGNIITIFTTRLSKKGEEASVQYFFSSTNKRLSKVLVRWEPSENTDNLAVKLINQFLNLRFLELQPENEAHLYYGKDNYGNAIKLSWAENSKSPHSQRPLLLSYMEFSK